METVNRKIANQLFVNKKLFGENISNYTAVCDSVLDESIMGEYYAIKDSEN